MSDFFIKVLKKILHLLSAEENTSDEEKYLGIIKGENVSINNSAIISSGGGVLVLEDDVYLGRQVEISSNPDQQIFIGNGTTIQDRCILLGNLLIGRYCTFSFNVYASSGKHQFNFNIPFYIRDQDSMLMSDSEKWSKHILRKIVIEDDCFIGYNVIIMPGVVIRKGSIIGANSVVTKNVEPYSIMVGSPAKLLKKRLEFLPKDSLRYDYDEDLPYFYSGVYVDKKSFVASRKIGGLRTFSDFTICLESESRKIIRVVARSIYEDSIWLIYHGQEKLLTDNFQTHEFIISDESNYHSFTVTAKVEGRITNSKDPGVLLQSLVST